MSQGSGIYLTVFSILQSELPKFCILKKPFRKTGRRDCCPNKQAYKCLIPYEYYMISIQIHHPKMGSDKRDRSRSRGGRSDRSKSRDRRVRSDSIHFFSSIFIRFKYRYMHILNSHLLGLSENVAQNMIATKQTLTTA